MSDRWNHNYWQSPIGCFELVQNRDQFSIEDGDGITHTDLSSTDRESAIREAEEWILQKCQETINELRGEACS